MRILPLFASLLVVPFLASGAAVAAPGSTSCPAEHVRVVRSRGGVIDYAGTVDGIADLCRATRSPGGAADFYMGVWRSDWPGAGDAYPAMKRVLAGPQGTRAAFVTRSAPGLQFDDSFVNAGPATLVIDGKTYRTVMMAHERQGIEGNTYHSVITVWRDVSTGMTLKTVERQISGQSYGPDTTWEAVRVETGM